MGKVKITKTQGGIGLVTPSADGIGALIATNVKATPPPGGFAHNIAYKLTSLKDAEDLLITESFDSGNFIMLHRHIKDFFLMSPKGTLFFISSASAFSATPNLLEKLVLLSKGDIRLVAETNCAVELTAGVVTSVASLTATQLHSNISAFQTAVKDVETRYDTPLSVIIEGRISATEAIELASQNAPKVSVCCAQDGALINVESGTLKPYNNHGLVGLLLGTLASANVNQNIGWVDKFNLKGKGVISQALFGSSPSSSLELNAETKRLIFLKSYNGISGIYFNDSFTSTSATNDFATIENNRTWDKAYRLIRTALLPDVNSPIKVDPKSGKLSPEVVKRFELKARRALDVMLTEDELSGIIVTVDPNQNILSTSELKIELNLVPVGVARIITGTIGFSNPF